MDEFCGFTIYQVVFLTFYIFFVQKWGAEEGRCNSSRFVRISPRLLSQIYSIARFFGIGLRT